MSAVEKSSRSFVLFFLFASKIMKEEKERESHAAMHAIMMCHASANSSTQQSQQ
jgi:hypothetical protein